MANVIQILFGIVRLVYALLESIVLLVIPKQLRYKKVDKDIVLITGGGSGLGRLLAQRFAKLGSTVVVWDINKTGNDETCKLVKENGGKISGYVCDVTDRKQVYSVADKVKKEVGKVSILINNAGLVGGKRLLDLPDEQIEKVFNVNTLSHFWTCKAFLPDMMVSGKGHIVNVASMAGFFGVEKLTEYCATKHSVLGFTESLVMELRYGGYPNIHCTAICPVSIDTGFFDGFKFGPIPMLKPDYVADEVVSAIRVNQKILLLPKYIVLLVMAKALFPVEMGLVLADIFGAGEATKNFRGRTAVNSGAEKNGESSGQRENGQQQRNGAKSGSKKAK